MRTTITARPCGNLNGEPLRVRVYVIDRTPEDWGDGRTRIFMRNDSFSPAIFTPVVVSTASIQGLPA